MEKKAIKKVAAVVVHPETGKEFNVTHQIDVQGWLDLGYTLKGQKAPKEEVVLTGTVVNAPAAGGSDEDKSEKTGSDETGSGETSYDDLSDDEFIEAVKGNIHDLKADDAKRVAAIAGVEYTNKKDTMNAVQDKWAEEL